MFRVLLQMLLTRCDTFVVNVATSWHSGKLSFMANFIVWIGHRRL